MKRPAIAAAGLCAAAAGASFLASADAGDEPVFSPKQLADMLHLVMESDRTVYTRVIVNRLTLQDKVITASEHFEDDQALALPAQMFRFGSEMVASKSEDFSYSLQSEWAVNRQNMPRTDAEKTGLAYIAENPGERYYTEEELGGVTYFTAVYPDVAVAPACVSCHNEHPDSPRRDFEIGDVMGGVVIRIPLE
ncbi:MAG: DUF3365 domain-containing protein [Gammaproteobacteria bacterium]|nr:DUF3365 domain-containing protein [Gammaproteobacteria bacterium]